MNSAISNKMPQWYLNNDFFDLSLTNDFDSVMSCAVLKKLKGWTINYFYDFDKLYKIKDSTSANKAVMVDGEITKGKNFGNHPTMFSETDSFNKDAININIALKINRDNYFTKYCLSTLLLILSLYSVDISTLNEEQQMLLLCIDAGYKGYFSFHINDNNANKYYLCDVLEYPMLYALEQKHTESEFKSLADKYNLYKDIKFNKTTGKLETEINLTKLSEIFLMDLSLPTNEFTVLKEYKTLNQPIYGATSVSANKVFSYALTGRNYISASLY